ncbi:glycosyltransferase [Microbacterium saperdae]|uniref:Glycosyltransferase involved in cell wall biosynthesis n=1 Tax=Microbacterium saperdae TaxID=69368 RepID=A0A543BPF5_9MICO|nr:glycosyltransferase family 4 protein [Microbacterium saperdae]TQL86668.1 hypothetical protein FB560_2331 [Microbacterium saperdae]
MSAIARLKRAVVAVIPDPIAERVLPWRRTAFRAAGVSRPADAPVRLLIGPVNSAGQGFAWARAADRIPGVSAMNFMYRGAQDVFAYPADHSVSTAYFVENRRWQRTQRRAVEQRFTHVLVESGRALLGGGATAEVDVAHLTRQGVQVGLLWHGSDIRLPSVHREMEADSPFLDGTYPEQARLEAIAAANGRLMRTSGLPSLVSTPDLLSFAPDAQWLPVVVDARVWADAAPVRALQRSRPVVIHAPSRAGLKGTPLIAEVMRRLDDEKIIEYREVHGVSAAQMPEVYGAADIVLDQFSLGIYGVAACEAMASGRVVVSHVSPEVRERVHAITGRTLPVIEATSADLESVLRGIVADREDALAVADDGPAFVAEVHSGARSAEVLAAFLGVATATSSDHMGDWNDAR